MPRSPKFVNPPRPFTPAEQSLILAANSRGLSLAAIRQCLSNSGYRRGIDSIRTFLRASDLPPNHLVGLAAAGPSSPLPHTHSCIFCSWRGAPSSYYSHWRVNHRTRAGHSRAEIERTAPHA